MGPSIDLFCRVIDNLGDIGVSWRLARQLTEEHQCQVRLWVDHLDSLARLEPSLDSAQRTQTLHGIHVLHWTADETTVQTIETPADMVIAAFSCDLPASYLARLPQHPRTTWYQLDYLSAQDWVRDFHLQSSPRADGLTPIFFFPGFTPQTGGLIREASVAPRARTDQPLRSAQEQAWLASLGVDPTDLASHRLGSVFTYAHAPIDALVDGLEARQQATLFLLPQGVKSRLSELNPNQYQFVKWQSIPFLRQPEYDRLLSCMDFNLVRGEDSFVRAIWAGRPFIWHIYPQDEREHHRKLQAWLEIAGLPAAVAQTMHAWSDGQLPPEATDIWLDPLWSVWQQSSVNHRRDLLAQSDLATRLMMHWRTHVTKNSQ